MTSRMNAWASRWTTGSQGNRSCGCWNAAATCRGHPPVRVHAIGFQSRNCCEYAFSITAAVLGSGLGQPQCFAAGAKIMSRQGRHRWRAHALWNGSQSHAKHQCVRSEQEDAFAAGLFIEYAIGFLGLVQTPAVREEPVDLEFALDNEVCTVQLTHSGHCV